MPTVHRMIKCIQNRDYLCLSEIIIEMNLSEGGLRELCQDMFKEIAKSDDPALAYQTCYFIVQGMQKYIHDMADQRVSDEEFEVMDEDDFSGTVH